MQSLHTPFQIKLRALLIRAREAADLTQEALAELVETNQSTICNIEKGQRFLDVAELMDLTAALKVDPRVLLQEAAPETLPPLQKSRAKSAPKRRSRKPAKPK